MNTFTRNIAEKASFGPVAMMVLSDPTLADDFERVKQLYVDYHQHHLLHASGMTGASGPRSVAAVKTSGTGGGKKHKLNDTFRAKVPTQAQLDACKVKIKAYTDKEYSKLDWISRYKLCKVRQEQKNTEH